MLMDTLQSWFADKLIEDDRQPVFMFQALNSSFVVLAPKLELWKQLLCLLLLQVALQSVAAIVNYKLIVNRRNSMESFLIGWGIVIPLACYMPYHFIEVFAIYNRVIKMSASTFAALVGFRTIEAMYGTSPSTVEASLQSYVVYYSSILHFQWDPKTVQRRKITRPELVRSVLYVVVFLHLLSLALSFELHHDFAPFKSNVEIDSFFLGPEIFAPSHLANAYLLGITVYLTLVFGFEFTAFGEQVKGYYTEPIFVNPLFSSVSPSDFWARKWDLMIQRMLKYGAFLPAKKFLNTKLAVFVTFLVSGIFHDYVWTVMWFVREEDRESCQENQCFEPIFWKVTAFFAWNAVVIMLERPLAKYFGFTRYLPTPVVSHLVILTGLPVCHWYGGDWAKGGYFHNLSLGTWLVRKVEP